MDIDTSITGYEDTDYIIFIKGDVPQGYIDTVNSTQWDNREWNKRYSRKFRHTLTACSPTVKFRV